MVFLLFAFYFISFAVMTFVAMLLHAALRLVSVTLPLRLSM